MASKNGLASAQLAGACQGFTRIRRPPGACRSSRWFCAVTTTVCGPVLGSVEPLSSTCPTVQPGWLWQPRYPPPARACPYPTGVTTTPRRNLAWPLSRYLQIDGSSASVTGRWSRLYHLPAPDRRVIRKAGPPTESFELFAEIAINTDRTGVLILYISGVNLTEWAHAQVCIRRRRTGSPGPDG